MLDCTVDLTLPHRHHGPMANVRHFHDNPSGSRAVRGGQCLFVYGTLRRRAAHPMARFLEKHAAYAGEATWPGRLFRLAGYPGARPGGAGRDRIIGDVYRLGGRVAWLLARLDAYEGNEFIRRRTVITDADGRRRKAWIYVMRQAQAGWPRIASGDFLARSDRGWV